MENHIFTQLPVSQLLDLIREVIKTEVANLHASKLDDKLLSPREACNIFQPKISSKTLARWTKDGRIESIRIASKVYYKSSTILSAGKSIKRYERSRNV